MIQPAIRQYLSAVTPEERAILDGAEKIDPSLYMESSTSIVNAGKLLRSGRLITLRPHTRFTHFPAHTHDYIEVVYMASGTTTHIINGERILLREGELLFLGQSAKQEIQRAGENDLAVNFIILPQFFDRSLEMIGSEDTPLRRFLLDCLGENSHEHAYLHFKVSDVLPVQNLVENLLYTLIGETPHKGRINETTMGLLFLHLMNHTDRLVTDSREEEAVVRLIRYIEDNYRTASLTEAAELLHCDLYWLSREIKTRTGRTYTELLQEKRLSRAAYLLRHTTMKVTDVAEAVGYSNISYFHRLFYGKYRLSPHKYRGCK